MAPEGFNNDDKNYNFFYGTRKGILSMAVKICWLYPNLSIYRHHAKTLQGTANFF